MTRSVFRTLVLALLAMIVLQLSAIVWNTSGSSSPLFRAIGFVATYGAILVVTWVAGRWAYSVINSEGDGRRLSDTEPDGSGRRGSR